MIEAPLNLSERPLTTRPEEPRYERLEKGSGVEALIESLARPLLEERGQRLVRIRIETGKRAKVQIMIERLDRQPVHIDDCSRFSESLSPLLDVEDLFEGSWTLEVSSPGLDRPLVRPEDFVFYQGFSAKLETKSLYSGQRRFSGRIGGFESGEVLLDSENAESPDTLGFAWNDIARARLLLSDELIAWSREKAQHGTVSVGGSEQVIEGQVME